MPDYSPNDATLNTRNNLFSESNALRDLDALISVAQTQSATKLLILAGKPVVSRINGQLSAPLAPGRVHFNQTQHLVTELLSDQQHAELNQNGEIEINYTPQAAPPINIHIFYGDGAHNLVISLA